MNDKKSGGAFRRSAGADVRGNAFAINAVNRAVDRVRHVCERDAVPRITANAIVRAMQIAVSEVCTGRVEGGE